jgi:subtilase family serine protease
MKKAPGLTVFAVLAAALFVAGAQIQNKAVQKSPVFRPDLVVTGIDFQKVQSGTDSQGKTYWIFNVTARIKNQGNGNAGAFKVLVERNNGAGGAWQTACQTCTMDVGGLAAGAEMTTDPRQFNNANGAPSRFKFTADSAGQVGESNEGNNTREEGFTSLSIEVARGGGTIPMLKCDLTVVSLDFQNLASTTSGGVTTWTFDVVAVVKNLGPGSSPSCDMVFQRASVDDPKGNVFFAFKPVPALAANATTTISAHTTWDSTQKKKIYDAAVDCYGKVPETDENNNQIYKTQTFGVPDRPVSRPAF